MVHPLLYKNWVRDGVGGVEEWKDIKEYLVLVI